MVRTKGAVIWLWLCALGILFAPSALAQSKKKKDYGPPPVFNSPVPAPMLASPAPPSPSETYGDWKVIELVPGASYMATTHNEDGYSFGVVCIDKCYAFFNPEILCKPGGLYPILGNSPFGAFADDMLCEILDNLKIYTTGLNKQIIGAMEIGGTLSMVFPMKDGAFKVYKYSLTGAMKAAERVYSLSAASRKSGAAPSIESQTL